MNYRTAPLPARALWEKFPAMIDIVQPPGWPRPRGYANGIRARGTQLYVAGQIGWNAAGVFETDDFAGQVDQALRNVLAVLEAGGAKPADVVRMTWYITDKAAYLAAAGAIGQSWRATMGRHFPVMAVVVVSALIEDRAKVEIEATAVIPDPAP
jgi:enamine deaminase RidA (YjgF/YER057c/UK114 family)